MARHVQLIPARTIQFNLRFHPAPDIKTGVGAVDSTTTSPVVRRTLRANLLKRKGNNHALAKRS